MPASHEAFTDAFLDGRGRSASLPLGGGKSPEAPLGLLWQYPSGMGREALLLPVGVEVQAPRVVSTGTVERGGRRVCIIHAWWG